MSESELNDDNKARQSAAIGVSEYWLIDPERSVVLVGRLEEGECGFERFLGKEVIVSPTFPDFHFTASQVLTAEA